MSDFVTGTKVCSKCHRTLPLTDFYNMKENGIVVRKRPECIVCKKAQHMRSVRTEAEALISVLPGMRLEVPVVQDVKSDEVKRMRESYEERIVSLEKRLEVFIALWYRREIEMGIAVEGISGEALPVLDTTALVRS